MVVDGPMLPDAEKNKWNKRTMFNLFYSLVVFTMFLLLMLAENGAERGILVQ